MGGEGIFLLLDLQRMSNCSSPPLWNFQRQKGGGGELKPKVKGYGISEITQFRLTPGKSLLCLPYFEE